MPDLTLTFAMTPYDRVMPLITGEVKPVGITLEYLGMPGAVPQVFYDQIKFGRYDLSDPENQRKLDAADALAVLADKAGISLVHMAIAFVIQVKVADLLERSHGCRPMQADAHIRICIRGMHGTHVEFL